MVQLPPLLLLLVVLSASVALGAGNSGGHQLNFLRMLHGRAAMEAYDACKKEHGQACKVPCTAIPGCAGCHPGGCGFCWANHFLSADKKSCTPCVKGKVSKGGTAASCITPEAMQLHNNDPFSASECYDQQTSDLEGCGLPCSTQQQQQQQQQICVMGCETWRHLGCRACGDSCILQTQVVACTLQVLMALAANSFSCMVVADAQILKRLAHRCQHSCKVQH